MNRLARDEISTLRAAVAPELTTDYRQYVASAGVPVG
jgi:hypothetical protein